MDYREVDSTSEFVCRLEHGADWRAQIEAFADEQGIDAGFFYGLGAVQDAELMFYDQDRTEYDSLTFDEPLEVAACMGNISHLDGERFAHTHAVLSRPDGEAVAGELATLYNDATDGHMEFATVVPDDALTAEDFSTDEITIESVGEIEYMSGSVYKTDSTYGVETSMWAGDAASDLKEDIDAALTLVPQFDDVEDELATRIEEIQVETSGQTVTMSYEEDIAEVKSYAEEYVNQLVVLLMLGAGGSFSPSTTV